jgi:hypothetical protein
MTSSVSTLADLWNNEYMNVCCYELAELNLEYPKYAGHSICVLLEGIMGPIHVFLYGVIHA